MANNHQASIRVTYGQLHRALTALGFVRKRTQDFIAYREAGHDALIVLPVMRTDAVVGDPHLVAVRNTVTGKGVGTAEQLRDLLTSTEGGRVRAGGRLTQSRSNEEAEVATSVQ